MLRQLVIRDVVLIDRLELEFGEGLGVLTGETGAGKSILLDALGLALGARADSGLVRSGRQAAAVTAAFELPGSHPAAALLDEAGIDAEPGEPLLLRRQLKADGGSRAFVGGSAAPASVLREVGGTLVEIHGQHDDRGLLNPKGHRALLDAFGKIDTGAVGRAWGSVARLADELARARADAETAERDRDYLTHAAAEIAKLAPEPGEETSLAEQRATMQAGAKAGEALQGLDELLGGSDGALASLRAAARRIERGAADHPLLAEALASLDRAVIETAEAEEKIERAAEAMAFDPQRLELVESRLFDIRALARKHRVEADALAALGEEMQGKLALIEAGGERIAQIERQLAEARRTYDAAAAELRQRRQAAAERLDAAVAVELAPLKLEAAGFRTALSDAEPGPSGIDRVEFTVSTNPGAPFGPLTRIASGGELSRFILALKVALAEAGGASTMIFDEIDRGVGGAVASAIGERLARLAGQSQLLVVTHSPQVAARAQHHYRIEKSHGAEGTRTTVRKLSAEERREEIARMLSGAAVTDEARAQAARLLEAA
ncbi:MAG: DNA repair protein RecN [uncultured Sphingomonas sp.]|uniref:DNA repair protein RecN n=1 Tax=uncultured Sphingomonas sp. TaxID=158754 RepID=A0A6J4TZ33_9SPHN|nr:DNA repair protein RecN [uncultured Sphingomonas sp.]CAA9534649.1 MAG: DNA repair protein RecN [uncultured Sphingomonas sp.]